MRSTWVPVDGVLTNSGSTWSPLALLASLAQVPVFDGHGPQLPGLLRRGDAFRWCLLSSRRPPPRPRVTLRSGSAGSLPGPSAGSVLFLGTTSIRGGELERRLEAVPATRPGAGLLDTLVLLG